MAPAAPSGPGGPAGAVSGRGAGRNAGIVITKRAPLPAAGMLERDRAAVRLGDRAHDGQPEPGAAVRGRRRRGRSARTRAARARAGSRGRRPRRSGSPRRSRPPSRPRMWVPGGVWRAAFSIRLSARRCRSSLDARRPPRAARRSTARGPRPSARARRPPRAARRPGRSGRGTGFGRASARASSSRSPTSRRIRRVERSAGLGGVGLLAVELLGQQLEVGEQAGQRRAQLVRGVGDELALALERGLGLAARGVERPEHPVQRAGQLGDLVVGLAAGAPAARGRASARSRARPSVSCVIGRIARAARGQAAEQREHGAAEHAEQQEQAHAARRVVDVGERAGVRRSHTVLRGTLELACATTR